MRTFCMAIAFALVVCEANARLGETEAEINARMGRHTIVVADKPNARTLIYEMPGYSIYVEFERGVSISETYSARAEKGDRNQKRKMTLDEAEAIVFANGGASAWTRDPKSDIGPRIFYRRQDGAVAVVHRDGIGVRLQLREKQVSASDGLKRF